MNEWTSHEKIDIFCQNLMQIWPNNAFTCKTTFCNFYSIFYYKLDFFFWAKVNLQLIVDTLIN